MPDIALISLVEIVRSEDKTTFIVQSAGLDRQMPKIEAETIPACLEKIQNVFYAAHNGETEHDGTSIVWIKDAGDMTVSDPNDNTYMFIAGAPQPGFMGQKAA